jgi:hypothetical protein
MDQMDRAQMRIWLTRWRDNDAQLKPLLEKSELLREDIPVGKSQPIGGSAYRRSITWIAASGRPTPGWLSNGLFWKLEEAAGRAAARHRAVDRKVGRRYGVAP